MISIGKDAWNSALLVVITSMCFTVVLAKIKLYEIFTIKTKESY